MNKVEKWLNEKGSRYYGFCEFHSDNFPKLISGSYSHSDRWSMIYEWLHKNFSDELYEGIETELTEYWEVHDLCIKK